MTTCASVDKLLNPPSARDGLGTGPHRSRCTPIHEAEKFNAASLRRQIARRLDPNLFGLYEIRTRKENSLRIEESGKMNQQELFQLSDNELLDEFRKITPSPVFDAFFIGFLIGIVVFGIAVSAWGFIIIIPLFLIYLFLKKATRYEALKKELDARNLR